MDDKAWYTSKTILVSILIIILGALTAAQGTPWVTEHPEIAGIIISFIGLANAALRLITSKPIRAVKFLSNLKKPK